MGGGSRNKRNDRSGPTIHLLGEIRQDRAIEIKKRRNRRSSGSRVTNLEGRWAELTEERGMRPGPTPPHLLRLSGRCP